MQKDNPYKNFLLTGKIEGYSYLVLLFVAMPLKYMFDMPSAVKITGMLHGFLFVLFMMTIAVLLSNRHFGMKQAVYAFVLSLLPFGTFFLENIINQRKSGDHQ